LVIFWVNADVFGNQPLLARGGSLQALRVTMSHSFNRRTFLAAAAIILLPHGACCGRLNGASANQLTDDWQNSTLQQLGKQLPSIGERLQFIGDR
jgi:hypothetical protein